MAAVSINPYAQLATREGLVRVAGAPEGLDARAFADAALRRESASLYVARDADQARRFAAQARFFAPGLPVLEFPSWDCLPYDRISPSPETAARRMATLAALARQPKGALLVVATAAAFLQKLPPREVVADASLRAAVGAVLDVRKLNAYFAVNGYGRASTVREPGEYAVRGGVIDVFPPGMDEPVRLDLFGDQLDTIRAFDPESQRTTRTLSSVSLAPMSEIVLSDAAIKRFREGYVAAFGPARDDSLYEAISAGARWQGAEHYLPLFYERLSPLTEYLPERALIGLDHLAEAAMRDRLAMVHDHYAARVEAAAAGAGVKVLKPDRLYLGEEAAEAALASFDQRVFTPFAEEAETGRGARIDLGGRQGRDFVQERARGQNVFDAAAAHAETLLSAGKRVIIASWSEGASERLGQVLAEHGLKDLRPVRDGLDSERAGLSKLQRAILPIEHGFETADLAVLSEQDLIGDRLAAPRRKRKAANFIAEATSLSAGDMVVHVDHGIGRYEGLKTMDAGGAPIDCLELSYAGGDKIYLPVVNIELLSRYGSQEGGAQLDKLGGAGWQARKAKAKARIKDMAEQLMKVAAARALRSSEPLPPPDGAWRDFEARFAYEETDDQLSAIEDVVADLASGKPMDRLICGDVGFGKTEVAIRAAFIAAMNGRQVAVLAPTTLLARQHYKSFSDRLRGWPVSVGRLSRLVSAKEAADVRERLKTGKLDVVVGTHALLSKSVSFADLGLLIIDEEQRFGVKHKERLKELRADVHVLTLTATPIPRTLQLALSGTREMSLIATPPVDRLAVRTYVAPWDGVSIREALLREKYRGGQSYLVAPRISDLPDLEAYLRDKVPEVSFVTAHGQMPGGQLDDLMNRFYEGAYDVLLSTTIVESGLDIPTANTMVIWRADQFGLAQLYQLRGRVGRSKQRAFAYLTTPANKVLTEGAEKRLKVLQSLDSLGAGFTLASHDLDLRGGGNLLGEEQSGHIKEVGVELYQSMLEDAVADLRADGGAEHSSEWSPSINVGAAVLIPEDYVSDLNVRLSLYRRLAEAAGETEREAFAAELIDRFGPAPKEVEQLIEIAGLKQLCKACMIEKLDAGEKGVALTFREPGFPDPAALVRFISARPNDFRFKPDGKLVLRGSWPKPEHRIKGVKLALREIATLAHKKAA